MKYIIYIFLLVTLHINSQILIPRERVSSLITGSTQKLQKDLFKGPSFMQPIVYIDRCPLFPGILGITRTLGDRIYIIDISPLYKDKELERVLLHELVHVWQLHTGILIEKPDSFIYKSVRYPHDYPYETRPWEIEADQVADKYYNPPTHIEE